jgi:hypothetical protein
VVLKILELVCDRILKKKLTNQARESLECCKQRLMGDFGHPLLNADRNISSKTILMRFKMRIGLYLVLD